MPTHTLSRSLHDVGLAAWFGGTLANATALNPAAAAADSPNRTGAVANTGWDRWTPVNAAAIAAHVAGSLAMLGNDAGRLSAQKGAGRTALIKTGLTAAALGVTAYSRMLGKKVSAHTDVPAESGTEPSSSTPKDVAAAQRQLSVLQWAVPALTGALVVLTAQAGEEQRTTHVLDGITARIPGLGG
jgi:hypothetical protein